MSMRMKVLGGFAATCLLAAPAFGAITGSAHDFQTELSINQICVTCHAPHDNQNATGVLLWNHNPTASTFTAYTSPTLDGASAGPGTTSLLCLGCHDGTIAVDSYGGATGTRLITNAVFGTGADANIAFGADLSDDHPIGITYDPVADTELHPTTNALGSTTISAMLQEGAVECATCHDVHNSVSTGNPTLLVAPVAGSAICLACHIK